MIMHALCDRIFSRSGVTSVGTLANLRNGSRITLAYAGAVKEMMSAAKVSANQISAIAAHGQTLFHDPPLTLQWFDPSLLALETGCAVVSDFRRADCAAGGQGARWCPLRTTCCFVIRPSTASS